MSGRYIYQRTGGPLVRWDGSPPLQTRASDARSLGSLGSLDEPTIALPLPRPGSPEPVGCACGARQGVGEVSAKGIGGLALVAIGYFAYQQYKKRRR